MLDELWVRLQLVLDNTPLVIFLVLFYVSICTERKACYRKRHSPMRCFRKGRIADDLDRLTSICLVAPDAAEVGGDLRPTPLSFRTMAEGMLGRDLLLTPPPPVIPLRSSTL